MKLTSSNGKIINIKRPEKYRIKWDGKSLSKFQLSVKNFLEPYWKYDVVLEEFPIPQTRLSLDFFNVSTNVAVEVQGIQHLEYNKFFHGNTRYKYLQQLKRDNEKWKFCEDYGILLVEIYPKDELNKSLFENQGVIL